MTAAHQLYGGPLEGLVVMMAPGATHYPAALRLIRDGEDGQVHVHVYGINRGHQADVQRPQRPTYHYSHTTTV